MRVFSFLATIALAAAAAPGPANTAGLVRKASLGIRMMPAPEGATGVLVAEALPGGTAASIGLRNGDLILSAAGHAVVQLAEVAAYAASLRAGDRVELTVRRAGKDLTLRGKAKPRPFETYDGATVDYGAVPFRGGLLRDILVTPKAVANPPVLFLLPGYTCASIEPASPDDPYRRLGEELIKHGVAYYRVEKPGLGDSAGTPACTDIDFATELEAFRDGYEYLIESRRVEADRIFLFGHSLGGLEAPLIAAELPPRGVAVFGTVMRNWADYHLDIERYQTFLADGADPGEAAEGTERDRELLRRFYSERQTPAQLAGSDLAIGETMRTTFGWDGGNNMFGRSYKFLQDLAPLRLAAAWRKAKTNVLAVYGESDIVAIDDRDHKLIADIADFYRPGSGSFVQIAGTTHGMELVGNRHDYREKSIAAGGVAPNGPFNSEVAAVIADWIKATMSRPPVRLQEDRRLPVPPTQ
jgi:pimeloyl-ACP methyl ester carboxylesterase